MSHMGHTARIKLGDLVLTGQYEMRVREPMGL